MFQDIGIYINNNKLYTKMEVIEFRLLTTKDINDPEKYKNWSRTYEYPTVIRKLKDLNAHSESKIHNTSWGYEGIHVIFKQHLDEIYPNCLHTDIKKSNLKKTNVYDITKKPPEKYKNYFDFIINISTVEEVNFSHVKIINNLLSQLKKGGYLIITFDYSKKPGANSLDLVNIEKEFKIKLKTSQISISGNNSILPNNHYSYLNCGLLIIKKL